MCLSWGEEGLLHPKALQRLVGDPKESLWFCRSLQGIVICTYITNASGWAAVGTTPSTSSSPTTLWPGDRGLAGSHQALPHSFLPEARPGQAALTLPRRAVGQPRTPSLLCGAMQGLPLSLPRPMSHIPSPSFPVKPPFSPCPELSPAVRGSGLQDQPSPAELCWDCAHGIVLMKPPSFYLSSSLHPRSHLWARFGGTFTVMFTYMCCRPFCGTKFQPRLSF